MQNKETDAAPLHVEPILAVKDIKETIEYWHAVLGFPSKWTWGEPPNYGGVNWNSTSVQFNLAPELASASKGNAIFIKVKKLEELYQYHQQKKAVIVEPLENKPWGMAGYTVKEINGYYIVFAGAMIRERKQTAPALPTIVKISERIPTIAEYQYLASSVGWHAYNETATVQKLLEAEMSWADLVTVIITSNKLFVTFLSYTRYHVKEVYEGPRYRHSLLSRRSFILPAA